MSHFTYDRFGFRFYGEVKEKKKSGYGVWVWPDGYKYYGKFEKDLLEGYGMI